MGPSSSCLSCLVVYGLIQLLYLQLEKKIKYGHSTQCLSNSLLREVDFLMLAQTLVLSSLGVQPKKNVSSINTYLLALSSAGDP